MNRHIIPFSMIAFGFLGIFILVVSLMLANDLDETEKTTGVTCGTKKARQLNRGLTIVGVILAMAAFSYGMCKYKCKEFEDSSMSSNIFLGGFLVIGIICLVLVVLIKNEFSSKNCEDLMKWIYMTIGLSVCLIIGSGSLLGVRIYKSQKGSKEDTTGIELDTIQKAIPKSTGSQSDKSQITQSQLSEQEKEYAVMKAQHDKQEAELKHQQELLELERKTNELRSRSNSTNSSGSVNNMGFSFGPSSNSFSSNSFGSF